MLVALVLSVLALPLVAASAETDARSFDRVAARLDGERIPHWAVGVTTTSETTFERLEGVEADTPFLIGSVSKSMTATLVMHLVEEGDLALDDEVTEHLPDFELAGEAGRDITVRQLLDHTSGISTAAGLETGDVVDDDPDALQRLVRTLRDSEPVSEPGDEHHYSSANYLVLGAMVEEVTDLAFGAALERDVLQPLRMDDSIATTEEAEETDLGAGHRFVFGRPVAYGAGYSASGVPYGYVASTLADLTTYARFQLGADVPGARDVVSKEGLAEMHEAQVETSGPGRAYGLGWSVRDVEGIDDTVVEHTGTTPGYFAHVLLVPERGIAVVLLADAASEAKAPAVAGVGADLVRVATGGEAIGASADPLLSAAPWVVLVIALAGLLVLALQASRLARRGRGRIVVRLVVTASCLAVAALAWLAPGLLGVDWRTVLMWAPDLGWSLVAVVVLWSLAGVISLLRSTRPAAGAIRPAG